MDNSLTLLFGDSVLQFTLSQAVPWFMHAEFYRKIFLGNLQKVLKYIYI